MSLSGWFTKRAPKPVIGSPMMPTPASHLFSPLPETVLPPPHLISLKAGQGPSDLPPAYDSSNKAPGVATRTFNAFETFAKKHSRSQSAQATISSSRPSTNGHAVPQTPIIGTYTPGPPAHRSQATPLVGSFQALYPEQGLRSGSGGIPAQANGHEPNQSSTSHQRDGYSGRNRSKDSILGSQTGSISGTIKSKRKPVPQHNIFPDGTVEYTPPTPNVPASAPIQSHSHGTPTPDVQRSKRDSVVPIPVPPPQPRSAPVNASFPMSPPVVTTTGVLGVEQLTSATSNGSHPGLSVGDIYPAGYATVGKHDQRSGKDRGQERKERKRKKDKGSPPILTMGGEQAILTAKDSPLLATPLVTTISASSHVPGFLEVNGVSSTTASPGMSPSPPWEHQTQDQDPQPQPISAVNTPTPQHHSLQVPSPRHRSISHHSSNSPTSQPPSQRPSPKPSPTGSYLTVQNHSNQPSPIMRNGKHDARIQQDGPGTPSSSSTVMMSTPPINSSRVTLKDSKSTHSYSPARKDDQLYPQSGPHAVGKGSTGTVDTIADPRTHEKGYGRLKSHSYSQEQVGSGSGSSREQLVQPPVRSSTDPVVSSKSTAQNHPYQSSFSRSTQQQDPHGSGYSLSKAPNQGHPPEHHERKRTTSQDTIEQDPRHRDRDRERDRDRDRERERDRDRDRGSRRDRGGQYAGITASNANSTHPYSQQSNAATPTHTYTSQTQQGTTGRSSRNTSQPIGHQRTASELPHTSQPPSNRVAVSGHLSTPAPTKDQLPPSTPAVEPQQLKSASTQTLTAKQSSRPPSTHSTGQDSKKKGGLFSLFRSISNPSKARDPPPVSAPSQPEQRLGKLRRNSSTAKRPAELETLKSPGSNTTKVVELPGVALPSHQQQNSYSTNATYGSHGTQRSREMQNNQDIKVGNAQPRGFHPWKLLAKRHRTMSSASMDALDGTMVQFLALKLHIRAISDLLFTPGLLDHSG